MLALFNCWFGRLSFNVLVLFILNTSLLVWYITYSNPPSAMESTISWPCLSPWIHYYSCGVSFRMALEVCPFCERLYSTHSLPFHLPKCSDNPSKIKNMESRADSRKRKTKEIEEEARPTTRSLSRDSNGIDFPFLDIYSHSASQRICFVCGNGFLEDDLADHEENCLRGKFSLVVFNLFSLAANSRTSQPNFYHSWTSSLLASFGGRNTRCDATELVGQGTESGSPKGPLQDLWGRRRLLAGRWPCLPPARCTVLHSTTGLKHILVNFTKFLYFKFPINFQFNPQLNEGYDDIH